jgi:hypothetical protein
MKLMRLALAGILTGIIACSDQSAGPPDPLNGAWRLVTMHLRFTDGKSIGIPVHESLFIFANGYYSMGYAFGDNASVPYAERWHPDDNEKLARFNSIIMNAGSYRVSGSRLDVQPLFALAPEFIRGRGVFSYAFKADTLELTWEHSIAFDGLEYPSKGTVTLLQLVHMQ